MAVLRQLGCSVLHRPLWRFFSTAGAVSEKAVAASLTDTIMEKEKRFGARNICPVPVALTRGSGVFLWDVEGKRYFDFHSGYSTVNQGHRHPRIIAAMAQQAARLTLTSRGFYNDVLGEFEEMVAEMFGYDKMMPMNTGVEAVETGVKLARRWGYEVKGIAENRAKVYFAEGNFHGRSLLAVSASTDPENYGGYGPYVPNVFTVPYNDLDKLEEAFSDPDVCAFVVEPIQGENGVVVPSNGYLKGIRDICLRHNVLFVIDEIQTGLGRTGKMLAVDHEDVRPDIVMLGKALSGGILPVSCVLADDEVMLTIKPGQHGSTYGGSPLASRVGIESLKVLVEERMVENAAALEGVMRRELEKLNPEVVHTVRGRGLFFGVVINSRPGFTAWDITLRMRDLGVLARPTHEHILRLSPPLVITEDQLLEACSIIRRAVNGE